MVPEPGPAQPRRAFAPQPGNPSSSDFERLASPAGGNRDVWHTRSCSLEVGAHAGRRLHSASKRTGCLSHEKGQGHESPSIPSLPRAVEGGGTFLPVGLHAGGTQAVSNVTSTTQRKHGQVAVGLGKDRAGHSHGRAGRWRESAHPCPHHPQDGSPGRSGSRSAQGESSEPPLAEEPRAFGKHAVPGHSNPRYVPDLTRAGGLHLGCYWEPFTGKEELRKALPAEQVQCPRAGFRLDSAVS